MRPLRCDGSPAAVATLVTAMRDALAGGPAVLPIGADAAAPSELPEPPPGTALVIETSGSTGAAKRVLLSGAALRASAEATHQRLGGPGRWLLALPAQHIAGAQVIVRGLLAGHQPVVLDSRNGFRVAEFAAVATELLDSTAGRHYTSLVPTQLHRVLTAAHNGAPAALDALRRFDAVLVGGAATPPELRTASVNAGIRIVTTYGMSETAGGCVYDGLPLDGTRVRLDANEPGEPGRISLAGPMLASGYLGDPELTASAFVDGWFRTSDLGVWDADGLLRVVGRVDDVIISGGRKVYPAAVERVLTTQPGVRAACVVGLADPEWGQVVAAAVVSESGVDDITLRRAVRTELGVAAVPRLVRSVPELPLRGIGKPDRTAVARLLAGSDAADAGKKTRPTDNSGPKSSLTSQP